MSSHIQKLILSIVFVSLYAPLLAQSTNPFISGPQVQLPEKEPYTNSIYTSLSSLQKTVNGKITSTIAEYQKYRSLGLFLYVMAIAVGYGFFHAFTPGHGKNIIMGWILTSPKRFNKVLFTALSAMIIHVLSAVVLVYSIWFIIGGKISLQSEEFKKYLSFFAFFVLLYISLKQIALLILKKVRSSTLDQHENQLERIDDTTSLKDCFLTALGIGIVPCPITTVLTAFMIAQGLHYEGLIASLSFAVGMAGTLLIFSSVVLLTKNKLSGIQTPYSRIVLDYGFPVLGSSILIISAAIMIIPYV